MNCFSVLISDEEEVDIRLCKRCKRCKRYVRYISTIVFNQNTRQGCDEPRDFQKSEELRRGYP